MLSNLGTVTNNLFAELYDVCDILHCDYDSLLAGLVTRSLEVRHHEVLIQDLNSTEAAAARDGLCRALYGRMFTWIVNRVNESLKPPPRKHKTVGLLDLFGFEALSGRNNGFQQLASNYANERLHHAVTSWTLAAEQEEMAAEGVEWQRVEFFDNGRVCGLLEAAAGGVGGLGGGPGGVLAVLDEISLRKGAAATARASVSASSDGGESGGPPPPTRAEIFVRRLCETFRQHPHLEVPSSTSENKDGCSTSLKECFK